MALAKTPLFLCDEMLGKLCRWLRILGFESVFAGELHVQKGASRKNQRGIDDDLVLRQSLKLGAVLLTRDQTLFRKARDYVKCALVSNSPLEKQVAFVVKKFGLKIASAPREAFCPACGSELRKIARNLVKNKVFPGVYERQKRFWRCCNKKCQLIFWQGSHWKEIEKTFEKIKSALEY